MACRPSARTVLALLPIAWLAGLDLGRAAEPPTLSYEEARTELHQVSDALKASGAALNQSTEEARAARWLGFPDLSANVTQLYGEKSGTIDGTPLGNIPFSYNLRGPRSSIDSTWTIYSGGNISATRRALAAATRAASADLTSTEEDLDVLLAQAYFGLELAVNVERTRGSMLEQADRQVNRALEFERHGLIPKVERLSAQVSRDEAAREEVSSERDRQIAEASLRRLLHRSAPLRTSTPLFVSTRPLQPLSEWLAMAQRGSSTLAALGAHRDEAQQGVAVAESLWKPKIFAFGSYSLIHKYQTVIEPDWIAGVGVTVTLFAHEDRANKVAAARAGLSEAQALHDAASTAIATAVETNFRKVEQAREQFELLDSTLALAQENLRLREKGFEEGQATSIDVNEARTALAGSETERAVAAYDYDIALAQLLQAAGQARALPEYIQRSDIMLPP